MADKTRLEHYFKACVPLIFVRTVEDSRGVQHITEAAKKANLTDCWLGEWSVNKGLIVNGTPQQGIDTVSKSLNYLISTENTGLLIIHNIRQFISNFLVIQDLKDAAMICRIKGSYIVLVGAEINFPPELKDLVTVYDFLLPNKKFFVSTFSGMVEKYNSSISLPDTKEEQIILLNKAADAALGMTEVQGENALALSIIKKGSVDIPVIYAEKEQAIKQSKTLSLIQTHENLDTLGGFDLFKHWIGKRVNAFSIEAKEYGLNPPKGVLIGGLSGTGKTHCCHVIAALLEVPLIRFDVASAFGSLQGQTEMEIRNALQTVEVIAPCVLFVDEIEKAMAGSESSGKTDSGTTSRVMQTILTWLQDNKADVFVVATMNSVETIPPELLRKGRFDEIFGVDMPVFLEREEIFSIHIKKRNRKAKNYDLPMLAKSSENFTGAEIEAAIDDAMASAFSNGVREFTTEDILISLNETIPQSESQKEKITKTREWITTRTRPVSSKTHSKPSNLTESRKIRN